MFGLGYAVAWGKQKPGDSDLIAPPDGFAERTVAAEQHAVQFIIEQVRANPGEVTLLVIGPVTNIALAIRRDVDIVLLIKRIVYMGGACDVPGNVTPAAEFNGWFDPEAAKIVLREPIPQAIIPLDVTNTVLFNKSVYERIVNDDVAATAVTDLHRWSFEDRFAEDPDYETNTWNILAMAYLVDPTYASDVHQVGVDMDDSSGPTMAVPCVITGILRSTRWEKMDVVFRFDNDRFYNFYVDFATSAVPVSGSTR